LGYNFAEYCQEYPNGAARELEGLPAAFAGLLPYCALSGLLVERKSVNRINRKTGNRLKQQNVDSETGEVVAREDMVRGYEVAKGQYMIVEDEEIGAVQIESTRTIDIDQFVPKDEIDERYIDSPYYITPDGPVGQEAFAVIRDTIAKLNMVALGRVVLARREHVIALDPAPSTRARRPAKKKASR
jgi:Ku protein